jgi:hypothetical protein
MTKLLIILTLLFSFGVNAHCGGCGTSGSEEHSHSDDHSEEKSEDKSDSEESSEDSSHESSEDM